MFGYVVIDPKTLSKEERQQYNKYYCGLCHQLSEKYGNAGRATLTYDMTFLTILLSSLYEMEVSRDCQRCIAHPIKRQPYIMTEITEYAADMNVVLSYYQMLDDSIDDNSFAAKQKSKILEKYLSEIQEKYPEQCAAIADNLKYLGEMEAANELNPDLPANCFGELMG
jgi:hypothetical protein